MTKKMFSIVSLLVVVTMFLAACGTPTTQAPEAEATQPPAQSGEPEACASDAFGCASFSEGQTIKIGMGAPMTGDNANFGTDISQGAKIAIEDAGEFNGFKFELVAEDDAGTPEGGAAVANKLVSDPTVVAIAGHIFSGATEAAMPIYEQAGLPMMSPSATNPPLTQKGSQVFNRVAFTDAVQGKYAAEYLYNTLGKRSLAILHDGGAYGQGLAEVVRNEFTALGGTITAFEGITTGEADYSATLAALAAGSPEALYFGGYVQDAVVLVNQMATQGLGDTVFFGCDGTFGTDYVARTGANSEGSYGTSLIPPASDAKTAFDAKYMEKYGIESGTLSPFTWTAYDSAAVLIDAIKKVAIMGGDGKLYIPRGALVEAVRGTANYQGLTGTITCDAVGECNSTGPTFYVVQNGTWVEAQ